MAKDAIEDSVNVQTRLTAAEVAELDKAASEQTVPVKRAAMVAHILREWLADRRKTRGRNR